MATPRAVGWNREQEGFQDYWLWQYGDGPFQVLEAYDVPTTPRYLGEVRHLRIEIQFEPGTWYHLATPDSVFAREYGSRFATVMFHGKWLKPSPE